MALTASLLLARVHPFGDAGLSTARPTQAIMEPDGVPAEVRTTLIAKCADCHSMATRLPVYDRIAVRLAPVSWLIERDIVEGRKRMNLSAWNNYSADQRQVLSAKIAEEVKERKMPLPLYTMIHRNARVSDADVLAFTRWMHGTEVEQVGAAAAAAQGGDPVRGRAVFEKRCTGCHALERNREGPLLHDVFGRTSGKVAGFPYSPALMRAHVVWNEATLEQWLTDPDTLVHGNNMDFHVPRPQERLDLIRFLEEEAGPNAAVALTPLPHANSAPE